MRALLASGHTGHEHDHSLTHEAIAPASPSSSPSTLDLRIAAVFAVFAASLLGALPPVLLRRRLSLESDAARVLQAFAGATIAALAVVHVAPVAVELLATLPLPVAYDHLGGAAVLVGLFLTVSADGLIAARTAPAAYKDALRASLGIEDRGQAGPADNQNKSSDGKDEEEEQGVAAAPAAERQQKQKKDGEHEDEHDHHHHHYHAHTHHPQHAHVCARSLTEQRLVVAAAAALDDDGAAAASGDSSAAALQGLVRARRAAALAYSLEVGCVLHSALIGLAVGLSSTGGRAAVAALTAAVAVHQLVEGVALGCAVARAPFSRAHGCSMAVVYSLTTPAGVAVGIAIAGAYDPASTAAAAVTGAFSGLSAGLLLYLGLCQLMMEELSREDLIVRPRLRAAVHGAVLLGGALMCVLALWA